MADYADLEIRILERQEKGYPVEMTLNGEQEFPRGYLDPEGLPPGPGASPAEDGARLFACLLADERLKTAWAEMRGQAPQRRIRLRIDPAAAQLHALPWESLQEDETTLAARRAARAGQPGAVVRPAGGSGGGAQPVGGAAGRGARDGGVGEEAAGGRTQPAVIARRGGVIPPLGATRSRAR